MCKVMEDMRNDIERRTEFRTKLESIKSTMKTMKISPQQAMNARLIPVSEQPKYQESL